jgi:hypothetical protein
VACHRMAIEPMEARRNHDSSKWECQTRRKAQRKSQILFFRTIAGEFGFPHSRELGYLENGRFTSIKGVPGGNILSIAQDTAGQCVGDQRACRSLRISPQNDVREIPWADLGHKDHASVLAADRRRAGYGLDFFWAASPISLTGRSAHRTQPRMGLARAVSATFDSTMMVRSGSLPKADSAG